MHHTEIYDTIGSWLDDSGPLSDIVISSRVRMARNIAGFEFFTHADAEQQIELHHLVKDKLFSTQLKDDLWYLDMETSEPLERQLLTERHLISKHLAQSKGSRGVAFSHDESLTLMINEEDHLRIQVLANGLQLSELYDRISRLDDILEGQLEYSFSSKYGYLTACPTNVGTGIRVSAMLHLPALKMAGQMEKVLQAAKDMHLAVRGLYGEGSEPVGDFYQLSNQTTLGKTEQQLIDELVTLAVEPIVEYERRARQKLLDERLTTLKDKVFRAEGVLNNARLISSEETMYMLSYVRLGVHLGIIKGIAVNVLNELFLLTQPGHLQNHYKKELDPAQRDEARADFIRERLA